MLINETEIRRWWEAERQGRLVEVRLLSPSRTGSGYFTNIDSLISELRAAPDGYGVYYTINSLTDALSGRKQHEKLLFDKGLNTTSDSDIVGRDVFLVDIDPVRPAQTNASLAEVRAAELIANRVYAFLRDCGWSDPQVLHSGNGVHLKYRIRLANNEANRELVHDCLDVLDLMFSTAEASVDCSVFNASRICKLPGTRSAKGADTEDRPQRFCEYVRIPDGDWAVTENEYLQKLASAKPKHEVPSRSNNFSTDRFDIDAFLQTHNIKVEKEICTPTHRKIILESCPWDSSHKAPDAALFVMANGAIGFRCLHAHCSHYTFRDFRLRYDPTAYDRKTYAEYRQKVDYYSPFRRTFVPKEENPSDGPKWLRMSDIKYVSTADAPSIPTGYPKLDSAMGQLLLGDLTILSGRAGQGKSIFLNSILLNMAARGIKIGVWSGEFQPSRWRSWISTTAAGKGYVRKSEGYDNLWYCPKAYADKIAEWLDDKVWLYSCEKYSNNWAQLAVDIRGAIKLKGLQCIMLDNMSALDLSEVEASSLFEKQKSLVTQIKDICKELSVHIIFVVHPRKTVQLLRREDVMGDSAIVNLADNVIIVHRRNLDFLSRAAEFFRKQVLDEMADYDTVVELSKCRNTGKEDFLMGLYYEPETKRLKSEVGENVVYPWNDTVAPEPDMPPDPDPYSLDDHEDFLETYDSAPF